MLPGERYQSRKRPADAKLPFQRPTALCNARQARADGYCEKAAGEKTPHEGIGRCWLHGGLSPQHQGVDGPAELFRLAGLDEIINLAETMTRDDQEYLMDVGTNSMVVIRSGILAKLADPIISPKEMNDLTMALSRIDTLIAKYPNENNPDSGPNTPDAALNEELARLAELDAN
jgi:hypothetical protein